MPDQTGRGLSCFVGSLRFWAGKHRVRLSSAIVVLLVSAVAFLGIATVGTSPASASMLSTQAITFTSSPPASPSVSGTYTVSATGGGSGNPVTFSIDASSASGACTIRQATVTIAGAGKCIIDANQAGNAAYSAAPEARQSFTTVAPPLKTQTITFTSSPPASPSVGGTYTVSATGGGSGNPVTFSIDASSASGACTISQATVTIAGAGKCIIDANQAGNTTYKAAPEVQQSFTITAAPAPPLKTQTITFTSSPPASPSVGGTYTVSATGGGSGNPVTFSIDASSASGACTISQATVTIAGAGKCIIDANQAGNTTYKAAPEVQQSFTITAASVTTPGSLSTFGVYTGNFDSSGVESFASTTGADIALASIYLADSKGWSGLEEPAIGNWLAPWVGTSYKMVFAVPMITTDASGVPQGTLADGAAGDYNSYYVALAQGLVADGFGSPTLRLGWEFDGSGYAWNVANNTDAVNFAAYWRNIVTAMRSVPGANFKFVWNPAPQPTLSWDINDAYPGDSYVDYVALDVGDDYYGGSIFPGGKPNNTTTVAQSNEVFNGILTEPMGLDWLVSFSQAHNKPIAVPEWHVSMKLMDSGSVMIRPLSTTWSIGSAATMLHGRITSTPTTSQVALQLPSRMESSRTPWPLSKPTWDESPGVSPRVRRSSLTV